MLLSCALSLVSHHVRPLLFFYPDLLVQKCVKWSLEFGPILVSNNVESSTCKCSSVWPPSWRRTLIWAFPSWTCCARNNHEPPDFYLNLVAALLLTMNLVVSIVVVVLLLFAFSGCFLLFAHQRRHQMEVIFSPRRQRNGADGATLLPAPARKVHRTNRRQQQ